MEIGLIDILKLAGFDPDPALRTRLVRHQDRRYHVKDLRRQGWLELYQSYQAKPKFGRAKQIVSFYGLPGARAGFYGVYRVLACRDHKAGQGPIVESCEWSKRWDLDSKYFYELERDSRFDDFRDRIIIDWGAGALAWVQNLCNKPVLEILEAGRRLPPFEDYLDFSLTYPQMKDLYQNEEVHRDWRIPLSAVAGVYLILAQNSGNLYVGSASGVEGIWGRWRNYANSGHGDNVKLRDLIRSDSSYPEQFRFSVLQILPKTLTTKEVVGHETRFKEKLGSRATGLNS
jgi:hypothetical protein